MKEKETRGKRRLANILLIVLFGMAGLHFLGVPDAFEMVRFFTPYIFPLAAALYLGDGYFANQRVLGPSVSGGVFPAAGSRRSSERTGWQEQQPDYRNYAVYRPEDRPPSGRTTNTGQQQHSRGYDGATASHRAPVYGHPI